MATTVHPTLRVLPSDYTITFLIEPTITLRSCSSDSSEEEGDDGGFKIPFTTSPLDECRGTNSTEKVRDAIEATHAKKTRRRTSGLYKKKIYAQTMRVGR